MVRRNTKRPAEAENRMKDTKSGNKEIGSKKYKARSKKRFKKVAKIIKKLAEWKKETEIRKVR